METDSYSRLYYQAAVHSALFGKAGASSKILSELSHSPQTWGDFFQFYISIIFAMCICTARALSFQMASCLLHSGFHLEELFCICLQNWSQLCSSYQAVTWKREAVHALSAEDQCCDPPAFRRINLRDKFSAISFPQQSCLVQTPGDAPGAELGGTSARKMHLLDLLVTLRIALLVFSSRHLKLSPDRVRLEAIKNIVKHLYIKRLPSPRIERRSWIKNESSSQRGETDVWLFF